jgi:hypothetical protein
MAYRLVWIYTRLSSVELEQWYENQLLSVYRIGRGLVCILEVVLIKEVCYFWNHAHSVARTT